jgi:hypothetical protein
MLKDPVVRRSDANIRNTTKNLPVFSALLTMYYKRYLRGGFLLTDGMKRGTVPVGATGAGETRRAGDDRIHKHRFINDLSRFFHRIHTRKNTLCNNTHFDVECLVP